MKDGFIKVAAATPKVFVGNAKKNAGEIIRIIKESDAAGIKVLVFPELALTGATCGDLFFTDTLIRDAKREILRVAEETKECDVLSFVGLPVKVSGMLFNCVAAVKNGKICQLVSKANDSSDVENSRYFSIPPEPPVGIEIEGIHLYVADEIPMDCENVASLNVGCVIGSNPLAIEKLCRAGATVIVNPTAEAELIGREEYRRAVAVADSGRYNCAIVTANAGSGESTTDFVFGGHCIISENGNIASEKLPFEDCELICAVVDTEHLVHDRIKKKAVTYGAGYYHPPFSFKNTDTCIDGVIDPYPFIPKGDAERRRTCARILDIQAAGLAKRLVAARARTAVIGISGGLDSCLALLVAARAMELLGRPMTDITAVTMPCFGTTARTRGNAEKLCDELGTSFRCVDIAEAVKIHFRDIGHDAEDHSVVYENAQARERTQIIMDIANAENGIVVGTGDLSELALGWATYNGDHMSNYGVNGGIPKTLIRYVVAHFADVSEEEGKTALAEVLRDILQTPVSPELLPPKEGEIAQKTEDIVGPYELHDFFLYRFVRYGETPAKLYRTARAAFGKEYTDDIIKGWLSVFMRRFVTQQFKRSALPDGVKVGTVGLSPRGDFRMPSDAEVWDIEL